LRGDILPGTRKIEDFFECNKDMLPQKEKLMREYEDKKNVVNIPKVVISVATHDERLNTCIPSLKTLLKQTIKPYKIIVNIKEGDYKLENYANEFIVTDLEDNSVIEKYTFRDDWSYKTNESYFLNNPIKYRYVNKVKYIVADIRQLLPISIYRLSGSNSKIDNVVVPTSTEYQTLKIMDLSKHTTNRVYATNSRIIGDVEDSLVVEIEETDYNYCLYYKNAFGGYDYYLIDGNVTKSDNISANYYNNYANNTKQEFEKKKYLNRITNNYTLYTDYFTEDEQERFEDLVTSTEVYLHNLKTNEILPVNVTNTNFTQKTFTNNGKKLWYNIINVEVAREFYRR
jgi:hypothetical protein